MTDNSKKYHRLLVAGASGYVGGRLVPLLLAKGYTVRCLARNPDKLLAREWAAAEIVQGDVLKPETLEAAFDQIDVSYYLVHSMTGQKDFENTDARGAENFARAAKVNGIKRIIYLGGLAKQTKGLSAHLRSRQEVGRILGDSGIPVTELRASIIIGSGSASFEIIRDLVSKLPVMITPRWVQSLCEPIAIRNVLQYLVACLSESRTEGKILEIGGGEVLSYARMMETVAEVMGRKILMIPVPVLTPRLSAYWLNIVTTVPMSIAFPLVEGLRNDSICTDRQIQEWVKIELLDFKESVRLALNSQLGGELISRWTEASSGISESILQTNSSKVLQDKRAITTNVSPDQIFKLIQQIGGEVGWYYGTWLWKIRGLADRMIGGVGMRRGRRHPINIRIGDAIDFWRVEKFEAGHMLILKAEMKLPGQAWLIFRVYENSNGSTTLEQTAMFLPSGWLGILYWYAIMPAHFLVFRNMIKNIVKKALENEKSNKKISS
jgi:uncharacterized protein YbjT (DUF2867 family)